MQFYSLSELIKNHALTYYTQMCRLNSSASWHGPVICSCEESNE